MSSGGLARWVGLFSIAIFAVSSLTAQELIINAADFDSGNAKVSRVGSAYADAHDCIWNGGDLPNEVLYLLEVPVSGKYALHALYAAQSSRPVDILVDDEKVHTGFKSTTGAWNTKSAKWERQCEVQLEAGMRMVKLLREGAFPHICAIKIEPLAPLPPTTSVARVTPRKRDAFLKRLTTVPLIKQLRSKVMAYDSVAVRRAINDLASAYPDQYQASEHRRNLDAFVAEQQRLLALIEREELPDITRFDELAAGVRSALLANPLLDFDRLLLVRRRFKPGVARKARGRALGWVPNNYLSHSDLSGTGFDNEITVLTNPRHGAQLKTVFRPENDTLVRDIRLHYSAEKIMFSGIDQNKRWAVFQINVDGSGLEQLSPTGYPDLDFFDACYLPNGKIILCSNAYYVGVPCLSGKNKVSSLYLLDPATKDLRQLTFDQDHGNDPVVLNDGRVMYQRWEYSDIPHYFARRRMTMNPDGIGQLAFYGSNSWFPTAYRFAQPIPGHPTMLVGILSGHHCRGGYGDAGRIALLDPGLASAYPFRYRPESLEWGEIGEPIAVTPEILPAEQTGFIQTIPGYGKPVAGTVCDAAVTDVYLKEHPSLATHPHPLSEKYFLAAMKPDNESLWGIYLVDIFDNATLLVEEEDAAMFEPIVLRPRQRPPVIPDRVNLADKSADVHIADIYSGPGLKGVPRGTVKGIRVFAYHFCYVGRGGFPLVGTESGWDMKRVLGTARVEADGSACFKIPANTPISLQPLDAEGNAVQLMRSWLVGMPGERVSCAGCHEDRRASLPPQRSIAETRHSEELKPFYGGTVRPFAFTHEIYPVLERNCIGCHNDAPVSGHRPKPSFKDPKTAYDTLHPYVRRAGIEGDIALLNPMEYHTSTSRLFQMLEKGHKGVTFELMGKEARERLTCWIDLNAPFAGNWSPPEKNGIDPVQRRCELSQKFAGVDVNPEAEHAAAEKAFLNRDPIEFLKPPPVKAVEPDKLSVSGFPMSAETARQLQSACKHVLPKQLELGNGVTLKFATVPAGEFIMGSQSGASDERPRARVRIDEPFVMAVTEITNEQYAQFDPEHDTRYIDMHFMDHVVPGYIANHPKQPVARISQAEALAFCAWLSNKTGLRVTLPDEAQWEWAARAGTATQFFYGDTDADFGRFANLADSDLRNFRMKWEGPSVLQNRYPHSSAVPFPLHDPRFEDNRFTVDYTGQTEPNAWGLQDMIGNVSEWTVSTYRPYPYNGESSGDDPRVVARGGSWADRPLNAGSSVRRAYQPWQKVFDVGFRVIVTSGL